MKYRVSEVFASFQGEGTFTGMPTVFVRFFGCNLQCNGFGQKSPRNPMTYELPYKEVDPSKYQSIKQLPVFSKGCDSSYSWDPRFKHLVQDYTLDEIITEIGDACKNGFGVFPINLTTEEDLEVWRHPTTNNKIQICYTGGEPLMWQKQIVEISNELDRLDSFPDQITFETNGTKQWKSQDTYLAEHVHVACSPKLYSVSGEADAVRPDVIHSLAMDFDSGCIKFVHNGSVEAWEELDQYIVDIEEAISGLNWDIWIMPVGATVEDQHANSIRPIVEESLRRGYNISLRAQAYAFGNEVGT